MAVGLPLKTTYANGDVYSASDVNDTNGTINAYVSTGKASGVNELLNGAFDVWQRGTSFTTSTGYSADRWQVYSDASFTASQQTFTPGSAPVSGYEGQYYLRFAKSSGGTYMTVGQKVENVRTLAGQTVTLSFWARVSSGTASCAPYISQQFGSGGSTSVDQILTGQTVTTSWARYSYTFTLASIAGKTIGTSSYIEIDPLRVVTSSALTIDIWGAQLEAGSTATAFQTATGTIQGELAACQRYYVRYDGTDDVISNGAIYSTTKAYSVLQYPVEMRVAPTLSASVAGAVAIFANGGSATSTANAFAEVGTKTARWEITSSGLTSGYACWLQFVSSGKFLEISAEL